MVTMSAPSSPVQSDAEFLSALRQYAEKRGLRLTVRGARAAGRLRHDQPAISLAAAAAAIEDLLAAQPQARTRLRQENFRSDAQSRIYALDAGQDEFVCSFRARHLGGVMLESHAEATQWIEAQIARPRDAGVILKYLRPNSRRVHAVSVDAGPLVELAAVSRSLRDVYTWNEAAAALFVLTGQVPPVSSITTSVVFRSYFQSTSRLVLTVDPMLPADEVAALYEKARTRLREEYMPELPRPGLVSRYNAELATFVMKALVVEGAAGDADAQWRRLRQAQPNLPDLWRKHASRFRLKAKRTAEKGTPPSHWWRDARAAWEHIVHLAPIRPRRTSGGAP